MPYLNIRLSVPESVQTTQKIAALLTDLTAELLKKRRELTSVAIDYVSPDHWFVGGVEMAAQAEATFYLEIKVTAGTNSKDEKAAFVNWVFSGMENLLGTIHPASYVLIHEVAADAWGYQGATQEFRYVESKLR